MLHIICRLLFFCKCLLSLGSEEKCMSQPLHVTLYLSLSSSSSLSDNLQIRSWFTMESNVKTHLEQGISVCSCIDLICILRYCLVLNVCEQTLQRKRSVATTLELTELCYCFMWAFRENLFVSWLSQWLHLYGVCHCVPPEYAFVNIFLHTLQGV